MNESYQHNVKYNLSDAAKIPTEISMLISLATSCPGPEPLC